jgi:uncharacterized membrane protein
LNTWLSLSLRDRVISVSFALAAIILLLMSLFSGGSILEILSFLFLPMGILAVAINPASYEKNFMMRWAQFSPTSQIFLIIAGVSLTILSIRSLLDNPHFIALNS